MDARIFLNKLEKLYGSEDQDEWLRNVSEVTKEVNPYLEDGFFDNHFTHFEFSENGNKKENFFKFHQGMWHLHMAYFFLKNGFKLIKPPRIGGDDIILDMGDFKVYVECVCSGFGRSSNYFQKKHTEMSKGLTEINEFHKNFITKYLATINKNKIGQIKKRKKDRDDLHLIAYNEGVLINGFDIWNGKGLQERIKEVVSINYDSVINGIIYGSIGESSYCQNNNRLFRVINNYDKRIIEIFERLDFIYKK